MRTGVVGGVDLGHHLLPRSEVERVLGDVDAQDVAGDVVEALFVEDQRELVDVAGVGGVDDGRGVDVAEVGDLHLEIVRQRLGAAADDEVGLDAAAAQLGDGVLRGLGLLLAATGR